MPLPTLAFAGASLARPPFTLRLRSGQAKSRNPLALALSRAKDRCTSGGSPILRKGLDRFHELINVLKLAVHGGEPHVGNLVQLVEFPHDFFTDHPGLDLRFTRILQAFFNPVHRGFECGAADRPLFTRLFQAGHDFGTVERLPPVVFFNDRGKIFFNPFIGREATTTSETFPAPADDFAFPGRAGINHFVVESITEGTLHAGAGTPPHVPKACPERSRREGEAVSPSGRLVSNGGFLIGSFAMLRTGFEMKETGYESE